MSSSATLTATFDLDAGTYTDADGTYTWIDWFDDDASGFVTELHLVDGRTIKIED